MVQWVKNLPAVQKIQETWVQSLSGKDPLGKEMATHSSVNEKLTAWKIPWIEEALSIHTHICLSHFAV